MSVYGTQQRHAAQNPLGGELISAQGKGGDVVEPRTLLDCVDRRLKDARLLLVLGLLQVKAHEFGLQSHKFLMNTAHCSNMPT
jgi:hypothetical protein